MTIANNCLWMKAQPEKAIGARPPVLPAALSIDMSFCPCKHL